MIILNIGLLEVLDERNNGKEFLCINNMAFVKNINGELFFTNVSFVNDGEKVNNIVHLKRTYKGDKWQRAYCTRFWVQAQYSEK